MTPVTDPLILKSLENAQPVELKGADPNALVDPNTGQLITRLPGGTSTPWTDLGYGLREPVDAGAILLGRGLAAGAEATGSPGLTSWAQGQLDSARQAAADAKKAYEEQHAGGPPDDSALRNAGQMAVPMAIGYAMPGSTSANLIPRMASNAFTGGVTSMLGDPNASPGDLAGRAIAGGALGAGSAMATGGAARVAEPLNSISGSDVRKLMDIGVSPTPGQMSRTGILNRIEQVLGNTIPVAGDLIKASRRRAVTDLNTGVMNDVLAPIGEQLPKDMAVGRDSLNFMADRVGDAYRRAVPAAGAPLDQAAQSDLQNLKTLAQLMPDSQRGQFNRFMAQYVDNRISPNGHLTGESFKAAESDLGRAASGYLYNRNSDFNDLQLGNALREAQRILRDNLGRSSPQAAADLASANQAFSRMQTVSKAVARPTQDPGVFSPAQFQSAAYGDTLSRNARMRGAGPYQDLADSARRVLGPTVPDSGTPLGHAVQSLVGGGVGLGALGGALTPAQLAAITGGGGALASIYNPVSQPLIANILASRYPWMRTLAEPIRGATPALTVGATSPGGLLGP